MTMALKTIAARVNKVAPEDLLNQVHTYVPRIVKERESIDTLIAEIEADESVMPLVWGLFIDNNALDE